MKATLSLINAPKSNDSEECLAAPSVSIIIGDSGSTLSMAISRVLELFKIPLVSYFASCACLSDHKKFPTFFRTIPSDLNQARALAYLVQRFGWTWVGTVAADDDYGRTGIQMFHDEVTKLGVCIAYRVIIPKVVSKQKVVQIVKTIQSSTAKVIVAFSIEEDIYPIIQEIVLQNITDKQWIASEAWVTSSLISTKENLISLDGTIGFAIRRADMPELKEFLMSLNPLKQPENQFAREFWETLFDCSFDQNDLGSNYSVVSPHKRSCTGNEKLAETESIYSDISQLRVTYNMHKAIYAVAHALHNLQSCENGKGPFLNNTCANIYSLEPWQVVHYLNNVRYTNKFGEDVYFDENGDPVASYDLINWQKNPDGSVKYVTFGRFDSSASRQQQIIIDEKKIIWNGGLRKMQRNAFSALLTFGLTKRKMHAILKTLSIFPFQIPSASRQQPFQYLALS
ncbi:CASR protein, partial [Polypterus senegalus]